MPKTPDYFHDRTVLITGAASGIGRATALIFAREGANVIAADIDAAGAEQTAALVRESNVGAEAIRCDVTDRASVDDAVAGGIDAFGRIDFLFNSAGAAGKRSKFARHTRSTSTECSTPCRPSSRPCWSAATA